MRLSCLPPPRVAVLLSLSLAALASARAQNQNSTPAAPEASGETIRLSAFEVSAETDKRYASTSSLGASRIAVPITELDASVITITKKFIEDSGALGLADALNFVSGVSKGNQGTGLQQQNMFAVRGYQTTGAQVDGIPDLSFDANGGFDYALVDRVELIKGPAGVLYGQSSPGGVVNLVGKRPLQRDQTELDVLYGSYDTYRASVDVSRRAGDRRQYGFRVAAAIKGTDGPNGRVNEPDRPSYWINPSFSYASAGGWNFWARAYLYDDLSMRVPNTVWMFGTADGKGRPYYKMAENGRVSVILENQQEAEAKSFELGADHHTDLANVGLDFRFTARFADKDTNFNRIRSNGNPIFLGADGSVIPDGTGNNNLGRDPAFSARADAANLSAFGRQGLRWDVGDSLQTISLFATDLNLSFATGPVRHQLLTYAQLQFIDSESGNLDTGRFAFIDNVATLPADVRQTYGFQVVNGVGFVGIWPNPPVRNLDYQGLMRQYATNPAGASKTISDRTLANGGIVERLYLLKDRLILVAGARYDDDDSYSQTTAGNPRTVRPYVRNHDTQWSRKYGAVFKPYVTADGRNETALFWNRSQTFTPVFTTDVRLGANFGQRFPNRIATTDEFGAKVSLQRGRIVGTVSTFDTEETNALLSITDITGAITGVPNTSYFNLAGSRTTKGWEADLYFNLLPTTDLMLSYSDIETRLESGLPAEGVPESTVGVVLRHELRSGPLKGLSLMWLYNRWGDSFMTTQGGVWTVPAGDLHTAVLAYPWKNVTFRFRVENVLDETHVLPSSFWTGVGITDPINYRFSASYRF